MYKCESAPSTVRNSPRTKGHTQKQRLNIALSKKTQGQGKVPWYSALVLSFFSLTGTMIVSKFIQISMIGETKYRSKERIDRDLVVRIKKMDVAWKSRNSNKESKTMNAPSSVKSSFLVLQMPSFTIPNSYFCFFRRNESDSAMDRERKERKRAREEERRRPGYFWPDRSGNKIESGHVVAIGMSLPLWLFLVSPITVHIQNMIT